MAPRLPSAEDLGGPGSYSSGRGIASYDVTPLAKGAKDLGAGAQQLGQAMLGAGLYKMKEEERATTELGSARADANWMTDRINLNKEIADASDPEALTGTKDKFKASLERAAQNIPEGPQRDLWMTKRQSELATADVAVQNRTFSINRDRSLAEDQETLRIMSDQAATASPEDRKIIEGTASRIFQGWKDNGYVDEQKVAAARQAWANGYAVTTIQAMSPRERIEALTPVKTGERSKAAYEFYVSKGWSPAAAAGIVGGLIHEGGLNTGALNPGDGADGSDSIGIAQWNSGRAQQLKKFAADQGKDWRDFGVQLAFVDHELRTTEKDAADRLNAATSPREAAAAFVRYERPKNFEKGAEAAHGWGNRLRQAEGVFASYGGGKLPPARGEDMAGYITPDQKRRILIGSERELDTQLRQDQRAKHDEAATLQARMGDDLASIERTGQGNPTLTSADIERTMGSQAAEAWQGQRARSFRVYEALDGIEGLPEGEVERRLQSLEPKPGGDGYADDMAAYTKARTKADKFLQARRADPALAVEALPTVKQARAAAQYEGDGDKRQITPESAQAIVRARLATQNQLGIPEPMAVTRSEASAIGRQLRYIGDDDTAGLKRFVQQLQGTYGEYADEVLAATIQHQNINRDLAVAATEVLTKIGRGQVPNPFDQRRLERAHDAQRLDDALAGRGGQPSATGQPQGPQAPGGAGRKAPAAAETAEFQGAATGKDLQALHANRSDPTVLAEFDATYGPGTAKRALAEIDRRLGSQERR